jgi:adenylate cyclase
VQTEHQVTFDHYRLDLANEQVWQGTQLLPLTSKAFAVLRYLVEHAGQLVTKAELFDALWPGTAVSDGALTFCIVELRKALSDDAKAPRFIETVHRRGYRFIEKVVSSQQSVVSREDTEQGARSKEHGAKIELCSPTPSTQHPALSPQEAPALPLPDNPSLLVLPFTTLSSDPEQEYFSDGMTDTLITDLSQLSGLFIIARHSAFTYKGKPVKVQEVSKELGVRYVLEGSVQKANNCVRINLQLIDATTNRHLWAERYDRELHDIFALQDEVTQRVVAALQVQLTRGEQAQLVRRNTDNFEAYDSFLRGWVYYFRYTKDTNTQARHMFERAIGLDPRYADAYALLGVTYWIEWVLQWSQNPAQSLERFAEFAHQALALDDSLPAPHAALGYVYLWKDRQYPQGIAELQKAVSLAPNNADVYFALVEGLNFAGRHAEALAPIHKAMRLNPHYPANYPFNLGWAYQGTGQVEEALAAYKRAVNLNPDFPAIHLRLADLYSELGREAEARAEAAEVLRISPNFSVEAFRQNDVYADRARFERLVANLRKAGLK